MLFWVKPSWRASIGWLFRGRISLTINKAQLLFSTLGSDLIDLLQKGVVGGLGGEGVRCLVFKRKKKTKKKKKTVGIGRVEPIRQVPVSCDARAPSLNFIFPATR